MAILKPKPRAFVSFDYDNNKDIKVMFCGQTKNSRVPFDIQDWSSKYELAQNKWEEHIKDKVNRCNVLIVLVGKLTYTAKGVLKEINFAREQNVPVFGVYVDGASTLTRLPDGITRSSVIDWSWDKIASSIEDCMKKGKNK